jgi:wyosine [tRNA(Phe)-imidazoG37] synthetase (radical SAM superfamily)
LGRSLGIDPVPFKTCNLNCVYCQLGPTPSSRPTEAVYPPLSAVLEEVSGALASAQDLDYVTISGSGEPTLYGDLAALIRAIKARTQAPVAVVTNGTRLTSKTVREALYQADIVLPSLCAADNRTFNRVVRPPGGLSVEQVIAGLAIFRRHFIGPIWLEVMLVRGLNDGPEQLDHLRAAMEFILPDRVQLNTVVRPPAADGVQPVSPERLAEIAAYLGPRCEVIADFPEKLPAGREASPSDRLIFEAVKRRPMTLCDLAAALDVFPTVVVPYIARLMTAGTIQSRLYRGRLFYVAECSVDREAC